jgi:ABC-type multidrug transport system fused ATPase/permease subunit
METLRPDWPLLLATALVLAATIFFTLTFPLVIGEVFDVVRAHGGLANEAPINPFAALGGTSSTTPPTFAGVMVKLCACLVLSATGNAAVAWCSALLGERFGRRLRGRLMDTLMARNQAFYDASAKGDLVARVTLDVTVLQNTLAGGVRWGFGRRAWPAVSDIDAPPLCRLAVCHPFPLIPPTAPLQILWGSADAAPCLKWWARW